MNTDQIVITPVGVVRSDQKELVWRPESGALSWNDRVRRERASAEAVSRIDIDPALDGILDGIDEYSHLVVLWWPDRNQAASGPRVRVRPMGRQDLPLVGVFATRSPVRPNSILATVVTLVRRQGQTLEVKGLDAVDGTPILDIKPLTPHDCPPEERRIPEWLQRLDRERAAVDDE